MKNQVAVTGEGPTDYGCRIFDKRSGQYQWQWGPVIEILEKCRKAAENETEVEWVPVEKEEIKKIKLLRTEKNLKGRAIPARKFRNYCQANQIQYGIFYTDADRGEDSGKEENKAEKHFSMVYSEAKSGLKADTSEGRFLPMIPLKMIENWLLADEYAYKMEYGQIPSKPSLPRQPEFIWGKKEDPESDYPKNYLSRVLAEVSKNTDQNSREVFCRLAQWIRTEILRERCPLSFKPFYQDFLEMCKTMKDASKGEANEIHPFIGSSHW